MPERRLTRRTLLAATTGVTLGLAGCTGTSAPTADSEGTGEESGGHADSTTHHEDGSEHHEEQSNHDDSADHHEEESSHDDGAGHDHGEAPEGPSAAATVEMVTKGGGYHFEPHVVWVETGGTVTFENVSGAHSTTAYAPANDRPNRIPEAAEGWDSGTRNEEGATFEHTFEEPGVYDYFCLPHEATGMIGSVVVGEPDAHDQPGLAAPQSAFDQSVTTKLTELNEVVNEALGHDH